MSETTPIHSVSESVEKATHLLVAGSEDFAFLPAIAPALLQWWLDANRPQNTVLVTDTSRVGTSAVETWGSQKFGYVVVPKSNDSRNPARQQWFDMMSHHITHAFLFVTEGDPLMEGRELALRAAEVPTTVITMGTYSPDLTAPKTYPFESGDVLVLGPQVFISNDRRTINWAGENFVLQEQLTPAQRLAQEYVTAVAAGD